MSQSVEFYEKRKQLGLVQSEVASIYGVSMRTVQRYESGASTVPFWIYNDFMDKVDENKNVAKHKDLCTIGEIINSHDLVYMCSIDRHGLWLVYVDVDRDEELVRVYNAISGDTACTMGSFLTSGEFIELPYCELDFEDEKGVCMVINSISYSLPFESQVRISSSTDCEEFTIPKISERDGSVISANGVNYCMVKNEENGASYYMALET